MSDLPSIQQIIQDQLEVLPDSVREAVESQDWRRKVYDIGRKYALKIDQLGALEQSTYYTMIGLIPSSQYISELVNQVGIARDVASSLAHEIDDQVFESIRSFIMQMDGAEDREDLVDETLDSGIPAPSSAMPSREDLLREIENIGENSAPAPVVTFSPVNTQLNTPTASRPVDLAAPIEQAPATPEIPAPAAVPTPAPVEIPTPVVPPRAVVAPTPAPVELPVISFKEDAGVEFTDTPAGADMVSEPSEVQVKEASKEVEIDLDADTEPTPAAPAPAAVEIPTPVVPPRAVVAPTPAPINLVPPMPVTPAAEPVVERPAPTPDVPQVPQPGEGKPAPAPISEDPYREQF